MSGQLEGRVLTVSGAGQGIGRASALAMAREGARLIVSDVDEELARATGEEITSNGGEAISLVCDVRDAQQTASLVERAVDAYGRIDGALNNAGVLGQMCSTHDCTIDNWDFVISVNLTGVWLCMKAQLAQLTKQGDGGSIVNIASVGGLVGSTVQDLALNTGSEIFYATIGMLAMMSAVLRAPLAAMFALLELTAEPNIIFPGMTAVVCADLVARQILGKESVFEHLRRLTHQSD